MKGNVLRSLGLFTRGLSSSQPVKFSFDAVSTIRSLKRFSSRLEKHRTLVSLPATQLYSIQRNCTLYLEAVLTCSDVRTAAQV